MHPLLVLSTAFTLWMLYDALQRRAPYYWFCIISVPMGEFAYFFAVKIHDFDLPSLRLRARLPSVDEARYRLEQSPCLANRLALADTLFAHGDFDEAAALCEDALGRDASFTQAHFGLALCRQRQGDLAAAEAGFRKVVELDRRHDDFGAWLELVEVLKERDRCDEAIGELRKLVAASPRMLHSVVLARHLRDAGHGDEAARTLEAALRDHRHAQRHEKRLASPYLREARSLLSTLAKAARTA